MKHKHEVDGTGKLIDHMHTQKFPHHAAMRYTTAAMLKCRNGDSFDFVHALRMHQLLAREYFPIPAMGEVFTALRDADFANLIRGYVTESSRMAVFDVSHSKRGPYMADDGIAACLRGIRSVEVLASEFNIVVLRIRTKLPRKVKKNLRWPAMASDNNIAQFQLSTIAAVLSNRISHDTGIPVVTSHCDDRIKIMPDFYQIFAAYNRDPAMPDLGMRAGFGERSAAKTAAIRWVRNRWSYPGSSCEASTTTTLEDSFTHNVRAEIDAVCADIESGVDHDEFEIEEEEEEEGEEEGAA